MSQCLVDGAYCRCELATADRVRRLARVRRLVLAGTDFNSELYIVASQVGGFTAEVTTAVGCAVGQAIGKAGTVLALRRGGNSRLVRRLRERPRKPAGRFRTRLRAWSDRMVGFLGRRWWGVLIVFLSACIYIPPLYAVTLAVPATRMTVIAFGVAVLLGRTVLFLAIAFGASALVH